MAKEVEPRKAEVRKRAAVKFLTYEQEREDEKITTKESAEARGDGGGEQEARRPVMVSSEKESEGVIEATCTGDCVRTTRPRTTGAGATSPSFIIGRLVLGARGRVASAAGTSALSAGSDLSVMISAINREPFVGREDASRCTTFFLWQYSNALPIRLVNFQCSAASRSVSILLDASFVWQQPRYLVLRVRVEQEQLLTANYRGVRVVNAGSPAALRNN
ncbi:hypothetical protein EDB92DRAFT_1818013 [Lactarius akahatsu]|uniref:Uncharacterized protein n=1 Tax=Lactarius akahatsu TaxID=416441 RepID=A0AAD4LGY5_9AGAM|nr:hypothetical protein EDB92DRAFT_1818013 [Lactarius akahatsu]